MPSWGGHQCIYIPNNSACLFASSLTNGVLLNILTFTHLIENKRLKIMVLICIWMKLTAFSCVEKPFVFLFLELLFTFVKPSFLFLPLYWFVKASLCHGEMSPLFYVAYISSWACCVFSLLFAMQRVKFLKCS